MSRTRFFKFLGVALFFSSVASWTSANLVPGSSSLTKFPRTYSTGPHLYNDVAVEDNGNSFVVGHTKAPLATNPASTRTKIVLHRYNASGARAWEATISDPSADLISRRIGSLDSATLLVIYRKANAVNPRVAAVSKAKGTVLWTKDLVGHIPDYTHAYSFDGRGNFIVSAENLQKTVCKIFYYDSQGNLRWQKDLPFSVQRQRRWGGSSTDRSHPADTSVAFKADGNFVAAGFGQYGGSFLTNVILLDAAGTELWNKFYYEEGGIYSVDDVCTDDLDNIYYVVSTTALGTRVRKLDSFGNRIWVQTAPGIPGPTIHAVLGHLLVFGGEGDWQFPYGLWTPEGGRVGTGLVRLVSVPDPPYGGKPRKFAINANGHVAAVGSNSANSLLERLKFSTPDTTRPSVAFISPTTSPFPTKLPSIELRVRASDDRSPVELRYRIQAPRAAKYGAWQKVPLPAGGRKTVNWGYTVPLPEEGDWRLQVQVYDASRNVSALRTLTVRSDRTRPSIHITAPTSTSVATSSAFFNVQGEAADTASAVHLQVRTKAPDDSRYGAWKNKNLGAGATSATWGHRARIDKLGLWELQFRVMDAAGNVSAVWTVKITKK